MKKQTKSEENVPSPAQIDPVLERLINEIELICNGEDLNLIIAALSCVLCRRVVILSMNSNNINYIKYFLEHYEVYLLKYLDHYKKFHLN